MLGLYDKKPYRIVYSLTVFYPPQSLSVSGPSQSIMNAGISICVAIVVSTLVGQVIKPIIKTWFRRQKARKIYRSLVSDVMRHLILSAAELQLIKENFRAFGDNMIFRKSHLQKLSLIEGVSSFSEDVYDSAPSKLASEVHHLKLRLRNIEIDIKESISFYETMDRELIERELFRICNQIEKAKSKMCRSLFEVYPRYVAAAQLLRFNKMADEKKFETSSFIEMS